MAQIKKNMRTIVVLLLLDASTVSPFTPVVPVIGYQQHRTTLKHSKYPSVSTRSMSVSASQLHFSPQLHDILLAQQTTTNLLDSYTNLLHQYPITTKSVTAAVLACTGDAIAQWRSERSSYDWKRGAAFLGFGALYTGAFQHFWFTYMTNHIVNWGDSLGLWGPERPSIPVDLLFDKDQWWRYFDIVTQLDNPPSPTMLAAGKVFLNQFAVIPFVYMPLFFSLTGVLAGLDANQSLDRAQSLYIPILKRNWFFWLPMQFLQFLAIPAELQIPFLSAASLVWTVILSSIGTAGTPPAAAQSQNIAYETVGEITNGEEIVTILQVDAGGAVNQLTDIVLLEDVEKRLAPERLVEMVKEVTTDAKFVTGGLAAGLLVSAADEGVIGAAIGEMIGVEAGVGVAVATVVGAGVGLLVAASKADMNATSLMDEYADEDTDIKQLGENMDETMEHEKSSKTDESLAFPQVDAPHIEKGESNERTAANDLK